MKIIYLPILLFWIIANSCSNHRHNIVPTLSDTAKILQLAILEGISVRSMPSAGELTRNSPFGDTILITSEFLPLNNLPGSLDSFYFKTIPYKDICRIINSNGIQNNRLHYLDLIKFEKNDSGYYVHMECINCSSYPSGGALGLYFKVVKDSFLITNRSSSSIN